MTETKIGGTVQRNIADVLDENRDLRTMLGDLLALIHGDGGHHTAQIGYGLSTAEAGAILIGERAYATDMEDERDLYMRLLGRLLAAAIPDWFYRPDVGWDQPVGDAEAIVLGDRERIAELEDERIWLTPAISAALQILTAPEVEACLTEPQRLAARRIAAGPQ